MSRICSKFETKKSFTYIPHRIGTFFHLKFVLNRSSAKVQKESTKKQPCSLEAQLGSSLRGLLLQSASHAAFVVVPWALCLVPWALGLEPFALGLGPVALGLDP